LRFPQKRLKGHKDHVVKLRERKKKEKKRRATHHLPPTVMEGGGGKGGGVLIGGKRGKAGVLGELKGGEGEGGGSDTTSIHCKEGKKGKNPWLHLNQVREKKEGVRGFPIPKKEKKKGGSMHPLKGETNFFWNKRKKKAVTHADNL